MILRRRLLAVPVAVVLGVGGYLLVRPAGAQSVPPPAAPVVPPIPPASSAVVPPVPPASPPGASPLVAPARHAGPRTAGTDSSGGSAARPSPRPTQSPRPRPKGGGDGPGVASLDDALQRHDPVPPGVADQISVFTGGGTGCQGILPAPLSVGLSEPPTVPGVPVICVRGFAGADLTVTVTRPSGHTTTITRPGTFDGLDQFPFRLDPGSETGTYLVRADQDKETARTEFKVGHPATPTIWVTPEYATRGDTVEVLVGGFPPGRPAALHLYVCDTRIRYRTTLTAPVNAAGEARLTLRTSPKTPATCYIVNNPAVYDPLSPTAGSLPPHLLFWVD